MPNHQMHPSAVVKLGYCFDPALPFDDKTSHGLIDWSQPLPDQTTGGDAFSVTFSIREARTKKELLESVSINAAFEAKFALAKGKFSFSYATDYEFSETTLVYIVQARKTFERETAVGEVRLTTKGQKYVDLAISSGKARQFLRACGTEIVTAVARAAQLSIVYLFKTSSVSSRNKIRAMLEAKWKSGSASVDLKSEMSQIDSESQLFVDAFQSGASTAYSSIIDLIKVSPGDLPRIYSTVSTALSDVKRNSSPIDTFTTMLIDDMAEIAFSDLSESISNLRSVSRIADEKLEDLADYKIAIVRQKAAFDAFNARGYTDEELVADGRGKLDAISAWLRQTDVEISLKESEIEAAKSVAECLDVKIPKAKALSLVSLMREALVKAAKWSSIEAWWTDGAGCENWEFIDSHAVAYPIIVISHPELVESISVLCNNEILSVMGRSKIELVVEANGVMRDYFSVGGRMRRCRYAWGRHQDQLDMTIEDARSALSERERTRWYSVVVRDIEGRTSITEIGNIHGVRPDLVVPALSLSSFI